ncbi:hypothetical protein NliqN6_1170 [Naganishia liquefaciens]|uniref:Zn(2)-C6 fungal-type domain-containing protein n=1 Tax=Naganishia liquefaciens TaxID=104408 RepID=A0A8H3TPX4_9TREE|nr:hypothetical protein NliqN6_1170 [Naganishia liquefaciens]
MNEDIFGHDGVSDMASTPNAAELNAALPQLSSTSTVAFDAFDDLDINQTNFSELDEEEQDIAHIILSDPSLLGLDCLVGAGPLKNRAQGVANVEQGFTHSGSDSNVASLSGAKSSPISSFANAANPPFDFAQLSSVTPSTGDSGRHFKAITNASTERPRNGGVAIQTSGVSSAYEHRPSPSVMPVPSLSQPKGDAQGGPRMTNPNTGSRVGSRPTSPAKATTKPPTMRKACDLCHQAKQKCSGERPACERCKAGGWPCHYAVRARRRPPVTSRTNMAPALHTHTVTGGIKAPSTFRPTQVLSTTAYRPVQNQRPIQSSNATGGSGIRPQSMAPDARQKIASRSILPPPAPLSAPTSGVSTAAPTPATNVDVKQTIAPVQATQPRFRSIAGPIKAGMPNFGQFSANAFLAKKFPGLMPGASRPINSPGQLPYMSKAAALFSENQEAMSNPIQQQRPSKKRKTKSGGGVASAAAENDLDIMDGFGYLYGSQDTGSNNVESVNQGYYGPVGWVSQGSDNYPGTTPGDEAILTDRWHAQMRLEGEPEMRPEEYLRIIREDGLLADLDFERHLPTLAPKVAQPSPPRDFSPSHTQTSDDILQDVASVLDLKFNNRSVVSTTTKQDDIGPRKANSVALHPFSEFADADEEVMRLIRQEFGHPDQDLSFDSHHDASTTTDIKSSGDGSMTDMDAGIFGDIQLMNAADSAAFGDQVCGETFSSRDSHRSEASSVYHDNGEERLPDFMMEDLTDFAEWSAQAEQHIAQSRATSRFGTNPQQSPVDVQDLQEASLGPDVAGVDNLIQLSAKKEEDQFALDLASMFPDTEEAQGTRTLPNTNEDIIMDGGLLNIAELEHALQHHSELPNTPIAKEHVLPSSPELRPKVEQSDTPLTTSHMPLPGIDTLDELQGHSNATPLSSAHITTPAVAEPVKLACQHEVDISQIVRALSRLGQPQTTLGQLMPHLTRALETLASLHLCTLCAVNPGQTIPQLALLSRTCSILMRPHPLTPSPLPLMIAGGRTTFTGLAPEIEVHIIDILWANWRSHSLQKVFHDLGQRIHQHANECARKRHEHRKNISPRTDGETLSDGPTPEELRCDMMTLALKRFRTKVR